MKTTIEERLTELLKSFPEYWEENQINKPKVIESIQNYDENLIGLLLSDNLIRSTYSKNIKGTIVFKQDDLVDVFRYKDYWDNSYTRYSNEIGLTSEGKYLKYNSDVVIDFPFKDTVLEGGMTKEETGKNEVFYHNVLAREEIDILFSPKVFANVKKYDKNGEHEHKNFKKNDNLIIKGNNLIALHSLKERFSEKIKLIYIDPPYNTGGDSFKYNDRFNHSTWMVFMKNRLEVAKKLLADDGSIWINIDDDEQAYLKVLCDEVFGRDNFINNIIWEKRYSPTNDSKWLSDSHDFILVYAKNKEIWRPNLLERTQKQNKYYKYDDGDGRGPWRSDNVLVKSFSKSGVFPITNPNTGVEYYPPEGSCYRFNQETALRYLKENRFYFGKEGEGRPQLKRYLSEVKQGVTPMTLWFRDEVSDNQEAKKEVRSFNSNVSFDTPKPEALIKRVLHIGSNQGDLVLDFFMGSGTTQAVALKMKRQFIGIEQMDYIHDVSLNRFEKVIKGEQGGISKEVEWQGGGSFVYAELLKSNQNFIELVVSTTNEESLFKVIKDMKEKVFFNFKVEIDKLFNAVLSNKELTLEEKKNFIIESVDHNQNYVGYSEIDDEFYKVDEKTKSFNRSFYGDDDK